MVTMHRLIGLVCAFLFCLPAQAQEVAVLDFDAYGLSFDEAQLVSTGLRDAFLAEGQFYPLADYDIGDRLTAGQETSLTQARQLLSEARADLNLGSASSALRKLEDALALHQATGSQWARRAELADCHYYAAVALSKQGRQSEMLQHLKETLYLYPGYPEVRAPGGMSGTISGGFQRASDELAQDKRRVPSTADIAEVASRLQADAVVVGFVTVEGALYARLIANGEVAGESKVVTEIVPPMPGDPVYSDMAIELASGVAPSSGGSFGGGYDDGFMGGQSDVSSMGTSSEPTFDEPDFSYDIPDFDPTPTPEEAEEEEEQSGRMAQSTSKKKRTPKARRGTAKISSGKRVRYDDGPVTSKWWFWTATGAVVVGGGTAATVVVLNNQDTTDEPIDESVNDEAAWSLNLETGD